MHRYHTVRAVDIVFNGLLISPYSIDDQHMISYEMENAAWYNRFVILWGHLTGGAKATTLSGGARTTTGASSSVVRGAHRPQSVALPSAGMVLGGDLDNLILRDADARGHATLPTTSRGCSVGGVDSDGDRMVAGGLRPYLLHLQVLIIEVYNEIRGYLLYVYLL